MNHVSHGLAGRGRPDLPAACLPSLSPAVIDFLAEGSTLRFVPIDTDLVIETSSKRSLHFLIEGWACRYATLQEGNRLISAVLLPGDVCNIDALVTEHFEYGVQTLTRAMVLTVPSRRVETLTARNAESAQVFLELACRENAMLTQWSLSLGRRSAIVGLAHLFCELSARLGCEQRDGSSSFRLPLTQERLAEILGLTAVHVNRTLQRLRREGLIVLEARHLTIPSVAALRAVADFDPDYLRRADESNEDIRVSDGRAMESTAVHHL